MLPGADSAAAACWRVELSDRVTVSTPDGADATPHARKARALVAYLAAKPEHEASRAEVMALLWSDRGRTQARASLRQCLFELRAEAPDLVQAAGEQIFLSNAEIAQAPTHGGVWLSELDRLDSGFDRWLAERRPMVFDVHADLAFATVPSRRRLRPRWRWIVLAGAVALLAIASMWMVRRSETERPVERQAVTILPWTAPPADDVARAAAQLIAANLSAELPTPYLAVRAVDAGGKPVIDPSPGDADWVVTGEVLTGQEPKAVTAQVRTRHGVLLWSARLEVGADGVARTGAVLADWTATTLLCAASGPPHPVRRDEITALLIGVCATYATSDPAVTDQALIAAARRLVAAAPRDAYAQALLADALAESDVPQALEAAARREAKTVAERALALDPRTAIAFNALGRMAEARHDFAGAESLYGRGLQAEPESASLLAARSSLLRSVGRSEEALADAQRSQALNPGSSDAIAAVADLLVRTQKPRAAFALLDKVEDERGRIPVLEHQRFMLLLRGGALAEARAQVMRMAQAGLVEPTAQAVQLREIEAMTHPHGAEAAALAAQLTGPGIGIPRRGGFQVLGLASIGRIDEAFEVATHADLDTELFFRPFLRAMLYDPRFPAVARRQGLWSYWQSSGRWPDACRDPRLPWRCGPDRQ